MFRFAAGRMLQPLVEEASRKGGKIAKTIGDGAYDTKSNFRYLASKKIEAVIKVRKNSSRRAGGCIPRNGSDRPPDLPALKPQALARLLHV